MQNHHLLQKLISYLIPMIVLLILTPIFIEFFGIYLLKTDSNHFEVESKLIFYLTLVSGQIFLPLISSIDSGLIVLPMFELMGLSGAITRKCLKTAGPFLNTLLCISFAGILTSILCVLISITKQGELFSKIPLSIIDALFIVTGIQNLLFGLHSFAHIDNLGVMILFGIASLLITMTTILILRQTGYPHFLILFIIALIGSTNLLKAIYPSADLVRIGVFLPEKGKSLGLSQLINRIKQEKLEMSSIKTNIISIFGLALSPIISISTTLPFYSKRFTIDIDYNEEVKNFGLSTLFHLFFPAHISCSGSVLFKICGAETRIHSVLAGTAIIGIYFIYKHITPLLSVFVLALIPEFIGISITMSYVFTLATYTRADKIILVILVGITLISNGSAPLVLFIGTVLSILSAYYLSGSAGGKVIISNYNGKRVLKPLYSLTHMNIHNFAKAAKSDDENVVFDFSNVRYVDYTANQELSTIMDAILKSGRNIEIVGKPYNMNRRLISDCELRHPQQAAIKTDL